MQVTRLFTILLVSFFSSATADSLNAQTIIHVPLYTFHGDSAGDGFGGSVSSAGDVNGDGFADLVVGASGDDNNGDRSGNARVLSGSDGSVLYTFDGDAAFDALGRSVSGAGDVNGDGKADLIVGATGTDVNALGSGSARVLSGNDGSVLHNFDGDRQGDTLGWSVSGAGDVNGDGKADLIVGAPHYNSNGSNSGRARVLSGSDGSVLYNFDGDRFDDNFGWSVSGAGDVNGDGMADLIVGARGRSGAGEGYARVLSGYDGSVLHNFRGEGFEFNFYGDSVSSAGDVNGDGMADLIIGAPVDHSNGIQSGSARVLSGSDGSVLHNFRGDSTRHNFGWSVSGAGDVNGDGMADLIVGARPQPGFGEDYARVLSGSDGSVLYNFRGDSPDDNFGWSVSGAGDVNGDGFDDFIVGAPQGGANGGGYTRLFVSQIAQLGDVNHDGVVNFLDIAPFIAIFSGGEYLAEADTNEDREVDFLDIAPFVAILNGQ